MEQIITEFTNNETTYKITMDRFEQFSIYIDNNKVKCNLSCYDVMKCLAAVAED